MTDEPDEPTPPWRSRRVDPLVVGAVGIFLVSIASVTLHLWGSYVADARLEHVLAPRQFLGRHLSAWDDARGAGVPALYFSPTVASMQSAFESIGLAPWLIGRMTLTVYLTVAGCGAMVLASRLRPEHRWMPVLAGFLYAFSPFTSQFIIPSGLFVPAAALPWLFVITIEGVRSHEPWRHAARFALVVFAVGLLNTASLLYSLVPVAVFAVLLVVLEREVPWRSLGRFVWRTVTLTALVSVAMLVVLLGSLPAVARNISTTELPSTVAQTSSASESWRGLGFWLTYFNFGRTERPGAEPFFSSRTVIVLTYVPVALALIGATTRRVRYWASWVVVLTTGVVVMAGAHRAGDTPLASAVGWLFEHVTPTRALRSTYKAGPGVALVVALMAPAGLVATGEAVARIGRAAARGVRTAATLAACVVTALAGLVAFAGGWIFDEADSFREIPAYWDELFETMASHPDDRVVVFPGASRYRYDWGYVNDNLFDAELAPAAVFVQTVSGATSSYTSVIEELDERISTDDLDPDAFAPMVRLLGARWVLVQRDLLDLDLELPDRLRSAPGLSLAATFGALADGSPALELYRLEGADPLDAIWTEEAPVLVSGGEGTLANVIGVVDAPVVNLTALDERTRDRLVSSGAEIVVSDGAQRRGVRLGVRRSTSVVLPADAEPTRPVLTTDPDDSSTQTVLDTGPVTIDSGSDFETGDQWSPGGQPSLLLDGSLETGWRIPQLTTSAVGRRVHVRLDRPTLLESIVVRPLTDVEERVVAVEVRDWSDGVPTVAQVVLDPEGPTRVGIQRRVDELAITITATSGGDGAVGLAELELIAAGGPIDSASSLRVPTEIEQVPTRSDTPISYVFGRLADGEELILRRRFTAVQTHELDVVVRAWSDAPIATVDDGCVDLFSIDGVGVPVRPLGPPPTRTGEVVELEGCETVVLEPGEHVLEELPTAGGTVASIALRDVRAVSSSHDGDRIPDVRRSSSRHEYDVPVGRGLLATTIPYDPRWTMSVGGRTADRLDGFAGTAWEIGGGDAATGTVRYRPQRRYGAALLVTAVSVVACAWLAFRRRSA